MSTHESAMGRSHTSILVLNNPYPFFKYHQNDKDVKTEHLSIEGKTNASSKSVYDMSCANY